MEKLIAVADPILADAAAELDSLGLEAPAIGHCLCAAGVAYFEHHLCCRESELEHLAVVKEAIEDRMAALKAMLS